MRDEPALSGSEVQDDQDGLPAWMRRYGRAAIWILAMGAVVYFAFRTFQTVSVVFLAVVLALFPASVLWRPVRWLDRKGWPPLLATWTVMLAAVAILVGIGFLVVPAVASNLGAVSGDVGEAGEAVRSWLVDGPVGLSEAQVDSSWQSLMDSARGSIRSGILGGASAAVDLVTGLAISLITVFFVLKDGDRMARGLIGRLPDQRAEKAGRAVKVGWDALATYMRGLAIVGLFDAVLIGIGLAIVGVPLVMPLAILVFFGAFFPIVGAWTTGLVAVAVAFVNGSLADALIVLAIITVVQQIEGDVILPMVFGQTLEMHPLVILLAVAAGGIAFGVVGAFLFVPIVAVALTIEQEMSENPKRSYAAVARGVGPAMEAVE